MTTLNYKIIELVENIVNDYYKINRINIHELSYKYNLKTLTILSILENERKATRKDTKAQIKTIDIINDKSGRQTEESKKEINEFIINNLHIIVSYTKNSESYIFRLVKQKTYSYVENVASLKEIRFKYID